MEIGQENLQHCKEIFKEQKSTYFFATKFFDREVREATYVVYAFFRVPDEIVDNPDYGDEEKIISQLEEFKQNCRKAYAGDELDCPVLEATATVFN